MARSTLTTKIDHYTPLLWIAIPLLVLLANYYTRKWYRARKLRLYGIGKGAPGFQTSVAQISVTPEIAARLRRGEQVSPEEIAQASAKASQARKREETSVDASEEKSTDSEPTNEWLPETVTKPKKRVKGRRK